MDMGIAPSIVLFTFYFLLFDNSCPGNLHFFEWFITTISRDHGDCFDDFHTCDDLSEDAMFAIEPSRFLRVDDEKLTSIGVWSSICHRDIAFFV